MDGLSFFKLLCILNKSFTGKVINKIAVKDDLVYFSIYADKLHDFLFRAAPQPPTLITSGEFLGDTHGAVNNISGSVILKIFSVNYERAGIIEIEKRKASGKLMRYKLVLEPAGNYANFLILDEDDTILYSLSSRTIDPDRNIGAGAKYSFPRPNKRFSLDDTGTAVSTAELSGFYPITSKYADEMIKESAGFAEGAEKIKTLMLADDFFYIDAKDKVIPFKINNPKAVIKYTELKEYYKLKDSSGARSDDKLKLEIRKIYLKEVKKNLTLIDKLSLELSEAENYQLLVDEASLIKNNLHKVKGEGVYQFERYLGDKVEIVDYPVAYGDDLNKKADKLFRRVARTKKSIPMIEEMLSNAKQMLSSSEEQIFYIDSAEDISELKQLYLELKSTTGSSKNIKTKKTELPFNIIASDGRTVYIGRNSLSNHKLVTQFAIDTDVWFHARLIPSAHLIVRLEAGRTLTDEMILDAAKIVASTSKNFKDDKIAVDYTLRKYVTKPKGTPIGFVTYKNFSTVIVKPISRQEYTALIASV